MGAASSSTQDNAVAEIERVSHDRARAWPKLLGADAIRERYSPRYYRALRKTSKLDNGAVLARQHQMISKDARRLCTLAMPTCPAAPTAAADAPARRPAPPADGWAAARFCEVLCAFAVHNTEVRYVPSIGAITVALITTIGQEVDDETIFWCIVTIVEGLHLFRNSDPMFGNTLISRDNSGCAVLPSLSHELPHLHRFLQSSPALHDYSVGQSLALLGATSWVGTLFSWATGAHPRVSHLCTACIDACCLYGLDAARRITIEVLRRAEPALLRATEFEALIGAARDAVATIAPSAEETRKVLAAAFGSERSSRLIRDLAMKRKLLYEKVTTVIGGGLTAKAMRETATLTDASWSPQLHPLCAPSQRRAVRAVLMLHNRGADESPWGKLPADLVLEVLQRLPIEPVPDYETVRGVQTMTSVRGLHHSVFVWFDGGDARVGRQRQLIIATASDDVPPRLWCIDPTACTGTDVETIRRRAHHHYGKQSLAFLSRDTGSITLTFDSDVARLKFATRVFNVIEPPPGRPLRE